MKIKFHHVLAFFLLTLFFDFDYELSFVRLRIMDFYLVILVILMILSGGYFKIKNNAATISFYLFIVFILLNGIAKVTLGSVIKETIQLLEYVFIMHLIANATNEAQKRKEFLDVLFWGTGCIAFFSMMYSASRGHYANFKDLDAPKHSFAFFALLAVMRLFTSSGSGKKTIFQLAAIFLALMMLLLSGERKGWAAFIIGTGIFTYLQSKSRFSKKTINAMVTFIVIAAAVGTIAALYLSGQPQFRYINRQFSSLSDITNVFSGGGSAYESKSDEERIFMLHYGIQLFTKFPISGIGVDQFRIYVYKATSGEFGHDAHNFYLKVLVEDGIIGILLYLTPLFLIFIELWKLAKSRIPDIARDGRIIIALFFLGSVVNLFLAGKALSWLYLILPCGMLLGLNRELVFRKSINEIRQ